MIFCSVGTQLPFPRLVNYLISWAECVDGHKSQIIVQSGGGIAKDVENITISEFMSEIEFSEYIESAEVIVSHAGMGNIIRSIELNKPIVIVPRSGSLQEHRNDHQIDSANRFSSLDNVFVAYDYDSFCDALKEAFNYVRHETKSSFPERERLVNYLNSEIRNVKY
ncbi:TPA: glycosyltransferase [Raoultella ornithinolytica]